VNKFLKAGSLALLSIPLLWWAVQDISIMDIYGTLLQVSPAALLGLSLVNIVILLLFATRWWLVMCALGQRLPFPALVIYRLAGFGVSYFTPGPQAGGEPLQVHLLNKHHNLKVGTAIAGVTVDKLVEMLINFSFLIFGLVLVFKNQLLAISELFLLIPVVLLALPLVYLSLVRSQRHPLSWILKQVTYQGKWKLFYMNAQTQIYSAEEHIAAFVSKNPRFLLGTLGLSFFTWGLMIFEYWLTLRLFGVRLEPSQVIIALTAARVAFLIPVPAGLGALEAGQVAAMQILGVEPAVGISVSLIIRARDLTLGSLGLWLGGLSTPFVPVKITPDIQTVAISLERRDKS
jgi:glycosyltransferase 2 family protein